MSRWPMTLALWAGPVAIGLAIALLVASAPFFRSGPGTPTAGDERAWGAMWGALAIVALGAAAGVVANVAWLVRTLRSGRTPRPAEWVRFAIGGLLAGGLAALWFRP